MNLFGAIARHRGALASGATLTAAAVTVTTLAALYPGIPTADLDLDDGGVWVTKSSDLLVGHLNYPSRLLDGAARARAGEFDVLQAGSTVLVHDETGSTLSSLDPASVTFDPPTTVPAGSRVALGAETVAVRSGSELFVLDADALPGATFGEEAAVASLDGSGDVAVSSDGGTVFATSAQAGIVTTVSAADGSETARTELAGVDENAELTIAAVDGDPVVFDGERGALYLPGAGSVDLPDAEGGVLQLSGAGSDAAYIATPTALVRQPLGGGDPQVLATVEQGVPAAPVWLNGCAYAVWSGSGAYVRWWGGGAPAGG